jgi:hypothetical protein
LPILISAVAVPSFIYSEAEQQFLIQSSGLIVQEATLTTIADLDGQLPAEHSSAGIAMTDIYGYLLGTVDATGHITFEFHAIMPSDVSPETRARYGSELVQQCYAENKSNYMADGPTCPK